MGWLLDLYETYEANIDKVGEMKVNRYGQPYTLLPISHTTQTAHIEVTITEDGEFHSADVITDKNDANTVILCTEKSASRTSDVVPSPLHDKLNYVAGDFVAYGGKVRKGKKGKSPFSEYIDGLAKWVNSPHVTGKVKSIYTYLQKKQLIQELVKEKILFLDENGNLIKKWNKGYEVLHGEKPDIFSVVVGDQESAFVRFNVRSLSKEVTNVWQDAEVSRSFIAYINEMLGETDICYVTGEELPGIHLHASRIRHAGDKTKLISASKGMLTFRGRFHDVGEVASISYEVSQKAHNALKWLINLQGKVVDGRVFLVWGNESTSMPNPIDDPFSFFPSEVERISTTTQEEFASEVAKALDGYKNDLDTKAAINILILDAASSDAKGRLAVVHYQNIDKNLYLDKLKEWHSTCVWVHRYHKGKNGKPVEFYGAPATKDIAFAAYGSYVDSKIVRDLMGRMLSCVIDTSNQRIPRDILNSVVLRASNPVAMDTMQEWEKTLSIACALVNKEEGYPVALNVETKDRDYLFGRLLAIADVLERRAVGVGSNDDYTTNAHRYMVEFSNHPVRTWKTIHESLNPYQVKLGAKGVYLSKLIDDVLASFKYEEFNDQRLSGKYLLGMSSQRNALYTKKEDTKN